MIFVLFSYCFRLLYKVGFLRFRIGSGLIVINLLVITLMLLIVPVLFPESYNTLRFILGLPLMLFSPGYALVAALFPREGGIDALERPAISFGVSIAILALIGLILNCATAGITIENVVYFSAGFYPGGICHCPLAASLHRAYGQVQFTSFLGAAAQVKVQHLRRASLFLVGIYYNVSIGVFWPNLSSLPIG